MKEKQLEWLAAIYPTFGKIAQAIIVDSVTMAEDAVSNAMEQIIVTVNKNHCRADTPAQFQAWCRMLVRGHAKTACIKYNGDVRIDFGKKHVMKHMRPDRRRSSPLDIDDFDPEMVPFDREETVGEDETEDLQ